VLLGVLAVGPIVFVYLARAGDGGNSWDLSSLDAGGADFLTVDPSLSLWGGARGSPLGFLGQPTFPGVTLLVLGVVGLTEFRRRRTVALTATVLVVGAAVLAVGTSNKGWRAFAPYRLVYEYMPLGSSLRATGRFWLVGLLGLGLLAGLGVERLGTALASARAERGWSTQRVVWVIAIVGLIGIAAEGYRPWTHLKSVPAAAVDNALREAKDKAAVIYLPVPEAKRTSITRLGDAPNVYASTRHHRPTANGYGGFSPDSYDYMLHKMATFPDRASIRYLRSIDVGYVVVRNDTGKESPLLDRVSRAPELVRLRDFGGIVLFRLTP
jgi:hypothetical protein